MAKNIRCFALNDQRNNALGYFLLLLI